MFFDEVCTFLDARNDATRRTALVISALFPSSRRALLRNGGLRFGAIDVSLSDDGLSFEIHSDCSVPPLQWWNYTGSIAVCGSGASSTACELVTFIKSWWSESAVTHVELTHEDEVEVDEQRKILSLLNTICSDLCELRLSNFYLSDNDELPEFDVLRSLFLTNFSGSIEKWSNVLNGSVERVEICDTNAFTQKSFAMLTANSWHRLILDSTDVTAENVDQLQCAHSLLTLSLIDCRKVDSLDVGKFNNLRLLLLGRSPISSEFLTGIERCSALRLINLGGCHGVTDINVLGSLKELREVFVHETNVTNEGIARLCECDSLEKLNLGGCRHVSDVNHLGKLSGLKELHLWSTKVSNTGIQNLCFCYSLAELVLDDCVRITDVSALGRLPSLRWLSLIGTEVNGNGIRELIHCRALETLALAGSRVIKPPKLWRHDAIVDYLQQFQ